MIGALIIVFREVLEAGLIIGIVWSVARHLAAAKGWILGGLLAGLLGSGVVALFTGAIANAFEGYGQEIFNAVVLASAVLMLAWHNLWMSRHGRELAAGLRQTSNDVVAGKKSFWALAIIVFMAVLREGSEVVLFLYGVAVTGGYSGMNLLIGGLLGLALGGVVSLFVYGGMLRIPLRHFFTVTNWLITLLAAGMAAQSVGYLQRAGAVTVLDQTLWDTSGILSDSGIIGTVLHTLVGYTDQPTGLQLIVYLAVIAVMGGASRLFGSSPPKAKAAPSTAG